MLSRCAGDLPRPVVVDSSDAELVVTWSTRSAFQLRRGLLASYAGTVGPFFNFPLFLFFKFFRVDDRLFSPQTLIQFSRTATRR